MKSYIFDKTNRFFDFCESAKGTFLIAVIVSSFFILYSTINPKGIMAPGIYYFGVIISTGMFYWSATLQEKKSRKIVALALGSTFFIWAVVDTILRS